MFSETSDRVKGGGKNFLLCSERLGELFDERSVEDGCFVWMTPANSHLYSPPNHSWLKAFWRLIGWLMGQNQHMRAAGSHSADPWAPAPRISTAAASHLQQLLCCSVPYMTSVLPTEDENSPHWARCYNTSLSLTDECCWEVMDYQYKCKTSYFLCRFQKIFKINSPFTLCNLGVQNDWHC